MCRTFSLTLSDVAQLWFKQLKPRSISLFAELSDAFVANFIGGKKRLKASAHLNNVVQKEGELLKDYIRRFNLEALQVRKYFDETTLNSIMQGVGDKLFLSSLNKNPPTTLVEFMACSEKYVNAEETQILREAAYSVLKTLRNSRLKKKLTLPVVKSEKTSIHEIIASWEIERLIQEGHLGEHIDREARGTEERMDDNRPIEEIRTIVGDHQGEGDSNNARKNHARNISRPESEIMILSRPTKERKKEKHYISFADEDARGICHPHDDALVIILTIANHRVFRILVNIGSSTDILFTQAVDKMGIE
ncbi:uncharacterized protein LOC131244110 [Magnolia sinica]|uniref:uncharacterized protein LOC131244110 n=1 Tax=Magnolia sinica TaxID=86752 RepID=UPI002658C887|nr:uncharacterized protein LOC131244110 [Magnolia sinica]